MKLLAYILLAGLLLQTSFAYAQTARQNPIVYLEASFGGAWGKGGGLAAIPTLNLQTGRSLFTTRYTGTTRLHATIAHPLVPIPIVEQVSSLDEVGLLYGWRAIEGGMGYSFSVGVSYNSFWENWKDAAGQQLERRSTYAGVPFEANILWFKNRKEPFKIYGLIPVGPPTGFGGSIGFKLFGSLSQHPYAGLGLTYGLGWHKKYEEKPQAGE